MCHNYIKEDGSLTGYLYDGDCVVAEFDARGKVQAQYIHGPGLGADVGSLICAQTLGADGAMLERYYSHNWRGDTIGITDESGASLARYRYGAFGDLIAGDGGIANNILFSGKRYDSATGLHYFGARYYDASSGRFISRDPMGYIDGPNDYILAMNNPLLWIDPWGLCRSITNDSKLFSDSIATDPIRFTQTGYIPLEPFEPPNIIQIAGGYNVGAVTGTSQETGIIFGYTPKEGMVLGSYYTVAGGLYAGVGGSAGVDVTFWKDIKSINDLSGGGNEYGGSGEIGPVVVGVSLATSDSNKKAIGTKISVTAGTGTPIETHAYKSGTALITVHGE